LYFISKGAVPQLIDHLMNTVNNHKYATLIFQPNENCNAKNLKKLVSVLFTLVSGCATKHSGKASPPTQQEGPKLVLPSSDQEKLLSQPFLMKGKRKSFLFSFL
jgi:hypothetical protein